MASREPLYAKFGITAEAAQLFETVLGTIVLVASGRNRGWTNRQNPEAAQALLGKIERSTLGGVLKGMLPKEHQLSTSDLNMFEDGLAMRNSLFHGFYERHNFRIQTEAGRDEMIEDLEKIHTTLFDCWRWAEEICDIISEGLATEEDVEAVIAGYMSK